MSVIHALRNTIMTMNTIEGNIYILLKNVETILDKHVEFSKEAETVQDAYTASRACFDVLIENILNYAETERRLISNSREDCKAKLEAELRACE